MSKEKCCTCFTIPNTVLRVEKVISLKDSKGIFKNPDDGVKSNYEAELIDSSFNEASYSPVLNL